jgi:hypothetical protein
MNVNIESVEHLEIIDTYSQLEQLKRRANEQTFVLLQNYNHTMRCHRPVCSIMAVQVGSTLFIVDCLAVGMPR